MSQKRQHRANDSATPLSRHGLVTNAQLRASGLSRAGIHGRVKRGALHRRYHGVYSLSPGELSREGEWTAALLAVGDDAALGLLSAGSLWKVWRYREEEIDVLVTRRHQPIAGLRIHQTRALDPLDVYVYKGIRVTTVARMCVDLTDVLIPEELTNVIKEAAFRNRFNVEATRAAMARANGRRNLHVLEQALEDYLNGSAGLKSRKEGAFLALLRSAGLPRPRVNVHVHGIEVDFHWPRQRLVVEVDGGHHERPPVRRDDARRDAQLRREGWTVLRFSSDEIEQYPQRVLAVVGCALP